MSNASIHQYGPTPTPTCLACVPTVTPSPQPPLPYTGSDLVFESSVGGLILLLGVAGWLAAGARLRRRKH